MDQRNGIRLSLCILGGLLFAALLFPSPCLAWGVGFHVADGLFVIRQIASIHPVIASSIAAYPYDYLYGCISADIFIGKGYKRRDDHCHNWSVAQEMLSRVRTKSEKAFMYGYLSHLAVDIIPHNYFVPNQLYMTPTSRRLGHVYWEIRSDIFVGSNIWASAMRVIEKHDKKNDRFMRKGFKKALFPFFAKKRVYFRSIKIHNIKLWRNTLRVLSHNSKWEVDRGYIMHLNSLSLNLLMDFLKNPADALCLKYDPVGTDNVIKAKKMRRQQRKNPGTKPRERIFIVPDEIRELRMAPSVEEQEQDINRLVSPLTLEGLPC